MAALTTAYPVMLRGSLTTATSEDTRRTLNSALSAADQIVLDCSQANEVDVSFLQLLYAARRAADSAGKRIALSEPPNGPLDEALRRCGFPAAGSATGLSEIFPSRV